jgi:hypothetical protein
MKTPLTPAGTEPATFRFVAQHLNHCATVAPGGHIVPSLNTSHMVVENNIVILFAHMHTEEKPGFSVHPFTMVITFMMSSTNITTTHKTFLFKLCPTWPQSRVSIQHLKYKAVFTDDLVLWKANCSRQMFRVNVNATLCMDHGKGWCITHFTVCNVF